MKKNRLLSLLKLWPLLLALLLVGLTALADVTLPANLTAIEAEAFLNDTSLTGKLTIPEGTGTIGARAFEGCTGLTEIAELPASLTEIGSRAFADCTGLTGTLYVHMSVTLAEDAFEGTAITIVREEDEVITDTDIPGGPTTDTDIPGGPTTDTDIPGDGVITMTDLPEGIEYEMTDAGCVITGYTGAPDAELRIPATVNGIPVVAIGDYAFQDCFELTGSIVIPDTVTRIGAGAFFGCSALDGTLTIPTSVTSIGDFAFFECVSLTGSLTLPASVDTVGESAFAFCESMDGALSLPADISLGARCFQAAGFTGSITIPATMQLGANVFVGTQLDITWEAPAFTFEQVGSAVTLTGWNGPVDEGLTLPTHLNNGLVTGIAAEAFADIGLSGEVVIPAGVVFIGESAFRSNPGITALSFGKGLTTIQAYAFADCTGLSGVITLPSTVTALDETAFYGCNVTVEIAPAE